MAIRVTAAHPAFIYAFLSSKFDHFQSLLTGAAIPGISREQVLDLALSVPPLCEQHRIATQLEVLANESQRLEFLYRQKRAAIAELKQSLLQKVFSGELTAENSTKAVQTPAQAVDTQSLEFNAHVLAFSYRRHKDSNRDLSFGHVKAQNIFHLIESDVRRRFRTISHQRRSRAK